MFRGAKLFTQNVRFFLTEPRRSPAAAGLPRPGGRLGSTQGLELSPWSVFPHGSGRYPITAYLSNGGTLEHAQQIAGHASPKTTKLYDRTADTVTVDEIGRKARAHVVAGGHEAKMPHANQLWMLVGFSLFRELATLAECIEVFPQSIAHAIGAAHTHKSKAEGVAAQLAAASMYTGWPAAAHSGPSFDDICSGPAHDRLDAYLSAWVASLDEPERLPLGELPGDVIWVPRVG